MKCDEFCKKAAGVSSLKDLYSLLDSFALPRPSFFARLFGRKKLARSCLLSIQKICSNYPESGRQAFNGLVDRFIEKSARAALYLPIEARKEVPKSERVLTEQERIGHTLGEKLAPLLGELLLSEFASYPDIRLAADGLLKADALSESEVNRRVDFLRSLLQKGRDRNKKLEEMERFYKKLQAALKPLEGYRDLLPRMQEIQRQCNAFLLTKREFIALAMQEVDALFEARYGKMKALQQEEVALQASLERDIRNFKHNISFQLATVRRRLFEIFTAETPFIDLSNDLQQLQQILFSKIENLLEKLKNGQMGLQDFQVATHDLAYDHDVLQLRGECRFRATRLRELRVECHKIERPLSDAFRLLKIAALERDPLAEEIAACTKRVSECIRKLENPYALFQEVKLQFEDVNRIIRTLWVELEAFQKEALDLLKRVDARLSKELVALDSALYSFLDDLEEVIKGVEGKRPDLLLPIKKRRGDERSLNQFKSVLQELESRFPFVAPISFFMQPAPSNMRQKLILQARELHTKIEATVAFAKNLQYMKVFDEERVDVILEAFEHVGFLEEGISFEEYKNRLLHAARLVEEEVLLDIGGLDMRALLDIDEMRLQNVLKRAVKEKGAFPEKADSAFWLAQIQQACAKLFQERIEQMAWLGNPYALHSLIQSRVEDYIEPMHSRALFFDALRLLLVKTERATLEQAINKILSEIKVPDEGKQREMYTLLESLGAAPKDAAQKFPLQYLSGCLNYFYKK